MNNPSDPNEHVRPLPQTSEINTNNHTNNSTNANFDNSASSFGINANQANYSNQSHCLPNTQLQNRMMSEDKQSALVTYNHLTYLLYAISYFTAGILWFLPIVMNYVKRGEASGTWLETHFDWQIKTFWYSILGFAIGTIIVVFALGGLGISLLAESDGFAIGTIVIVGVGIMIMVATFFWNIYRIIRGWIALSSHRPVP